MISFSKVKSAVLENGYRIIKVLQFGAKTAEQIAQFGDDSSPLKNMTAIYGDTSEKGEQVILGYINNNQLAQPGEKRIFSLDENGALATSIWLKSDGNIELDGVVDNLIRYQKLNEALTSQNTKINAELAKIVTAIASVGGTYVLSNVTLDISASKITNIKTS